LCVLAKIGTKKLFKISSALKSIIGKGLITNDFIAVFELVKNSFDANATQVDVIFNGKGMILDDLINEGQLSHTNPNNFLLVRNSDSKRSQFVSRQV